MYKEQEGVVPLWTETQNVQADAAGHFAASLGSATTDGVPLSLFSSAEVHWVGVQISGQPELSRVLLLSVPYALKAADAETLGGMPASAFVKTSPETPGSSGVPSTHLSNSIAPVKDSSSAPTALAVTGSGTANFIPIWTGSAALGNQRSGNSGVAEKPW